MEPRPVKTPRKNASQARSRATVDALVEATARILVRDGFERASTNHIAAEAGVSIGSLYQYFPGKESLVAAVIERHTRDLMRAVDAVYGTHPAKAAAGDHRCWSSLVRPLRR